MQYENLSNAELKLKLHSLENEYEVVKRKINDLIEKMSSLDKEYLSVKSVLTERTKGRVGL